MNLVLEKQKIKQEIDKLNDESVLMSIKKILGLAKEQNLTILSKEDLIARALESEIAISENKFTTIEQLEQEMKNW